MLTIKSAQFNQLVPQDPQLPQNPLPPQNQALNLCPVCNTDHSDPELYCDMKKCPECDKWNERGERCECYYGESDTPYDWRGEQGDAAFTAWREDQAWGGG
jgi:hypothetical protein